MNLDERGDGRKWEKKGEGNYNQNILYRKSIFNQRKKLGSIQELQQHLKLFLASTGSCSHGPCYFTYTCIHTHMHRCTKSRHIGTRNK